MSGGFVKLYGTILDSSIWAEVAPTRIVWITLLAMADSNGVVRASDDGIARRANVSDDECQKALATLQAPDPRSKSKAHRGRRIKRVDGGWLILNYALYREMRTPKQVAEADRKKRYRNSKRDNGDAVGHVPDVLGTTDVSGQEEEAEADTEKEKGHALSGDLNGQPNLVRLDMLTIGELVNRIKSLAVEPPQGATYIPRKAVEALGDDIWRAYQAVGGAQRFLHMKGSDHSFLVREFTQALKSARREGQS